MTRRSLTLLALLLGLSAPAQLKQWLVREVNGVHLMDMTGLDPVVGPLIPGFGTNGEEDVNIMTDASDNVLFTLAVSNGGTSEVRDANFTPMPNGDGLFDHSSTAQSAICPIPCHSDRYYIVHEETVSGSLYYSVVDMAQNGGLGDVTLKNILIGSPFSEGLAISHRMITGCRWLFGTLEDNGTFHLVKCLIGETGIGPPQEIAVISAPSAFSTYELELSPDNTRLAVSVLGYSATEPDIVLYDLDLQSGTVSNPQELSISDDSILGIQFSPSGGYLYYLGNSASPDMDFGRVRLSDLTVELIDANMGSYLTQVELAGNGRIYVAQNYSSEYLSEVDVPDAPTVAGIGYSQNGVLLGSGNGCRPPLPNAIEGELPGTPPPPGYIAFSASTVGSCDTYQFTDSTCLGTWWEWDLGDGTITNDPAPVHQFASGTYDITLRIVACGDTLSLTEPAYIVSSTDAPVAGFVADPVVLCAGSPVQFTNASLNGMTYEWDFGNGDGTTDSDPVYSYPESGVFTAWLIATNGCGSDTVATDITVLGGQAVALVEYDPCSPQISVASGSGNTAGVQWLFGDGSVSTDSSGTHTYAEGGTFTVQLIVAPGSACPDTAETVVNVGTPPTAGFTMVELCDQAVTFTDNSTPGSTLTWHFGDGIDGNALTETHTYAGTGPYDVQLVAENSGGCTDTAFAQVTPMGTILASFIAPSGPCDDPQEFENTSNGGTEFTWTFGDGTSEEGPSASHTYAQAGSYEVVLIAQPGALCADTASLIITVGNMPDAAFTVEPMCDQQVVFTDASTGGSTLQWIFGDGSFGDQPTQSHTYAGTGPYQAQLIATNDLGCADTAFAAVEPIASIIASAEALSGPCANPQLFGNASTGAEGYLWHFGDGTTDTTTAPTHAYTTTGELEVMLIAAPGDACADTAIVQITVADRPTAAFMDSVGCGQDVFLIDGSANADGITWDLGDGSSSSNPLLSHSYSAPGSYSVQLIAWSDEGCADTLVASITIAPRVLASFTSGFLPCEAEWSFTNTSTNAASYLWTLGDGTTSTQSSPSHTFPSQGEVEVQLIAEAVDGCRDTATAMLDAYGGGVLPALYVPNCFTPNGDGLNELFLVGGLSSCFDLRVRIFNRWGELLFDADAAEGWDGRVEGTMAPDGTYVYLLIGHAERRYGTVTLLR